MKHEPAGPRRAESVQSYLRQTRFLAVLALMAFVAAVVSDITSGGFWGRHALLTGLVSSVIVVMLSVAVVNEVLERRQRQRWRILAQYVMFELVRNARMIWSGVLEVAGLWPTDQGQEEAAEAGARIVRNTPILTGALLETLDDDDGHDRLHTEIAALAEHSDEMLGRWASVMLNASAYAEIIDRHVELVGDIAWIGGMLDNSHPPDDQVRTRRARSSPALQIQGGLGNEWLADRIVVITQLAERLDSGTLELALKLVPVEWWQSRLRTVAPSQSAAQAT